jgi:hypothetical protein
MPQSVEGIAYGRLGHADLVCGTCDVAFRHYRLKHHQQPKIDPVNIHQAPKCRRDTGLDKWPASDPLALFAAFVRKDYRNLPGNICATN